MWTCCSERWERKHSCTMTKVASTLVDPIFLFWSSSVPSDRSNQKNSRLFLTTDSTHAINLEMSSTPTSTCTTHEGVLALRSCSHSTATGIHLECSRHVSRRGWLCRENVDVASISTTTVSKVSKVLRNQRIITAWCSSKSRAFPTTFLCFSIYTKDISSTIYVVYIHQ